jgi:hypothetical protein
MDGTHQLLVYAGDVNLLVKGKKGKVIPVRGHECP